MTNRTYPSERSSSFVETATRVIAVPAFVALAGS
jgi:hypothetical protein